MFKIIFRFSEKIFHSMVNFGNNFPFLRSTFAWKTAKQLYFNVRSFAYPDILKPNTAAIEFFTKNAERVKAVADLLADERSKNAYLGMIKYCQTNKKADFPFAGYEKTQYFIDELQLGKDEVFIHCGAYYGYTVDTFLEYCPEYEQIVAFEPEPKIFQAIEKKYSKNPKIKLVNAGAYDKEGMIYFDTAGGDGVGTIIAGGGVENLISVKVQSIDNLNLKRATFIAMDIEGAELPALQGAEKTILNNKPKLAISIYHSNEDMISIAEYIHKLVPEYKLYFRLHYLYPMLSDATLYALIK